MKECKHGRIIKEPMQIGTFAGALDICKCCENTFGHFGNIDYDNPLCDICKPKPQVIISKITFEFENFTHDYHCAYGGIIGDKKSACGCFSLAFQELKNGNLKDLPNLLDRLKYLMYSMYPTIEEIKK